MACVAGYFGRLHTAVTIDGQLESSAGSLASEIR